MGGGNRASVKGPRSGATSSQAKARRCGPGPNLKPILSLAMKEGMSTRGLEGEPLGLP